MAEGEEAWFWPRHMAYEESLLLGMGVGNSQESSGMCRLQWTPVLAPPSGEELE